MYIQAKIDTLFEKIGENILIMIHGSQNKDIILKMIQNRLAKF